MAEHCAKDAKPLQIVSLADDVQLNMDNLTRVCETLREHRADSVSIIGVMGSYRTGKSFLLDLLLRRMRSMSREDMGMPDEDARSKWVFADKKVNTSLLSWVYDGNPTHIAEGKPGEHTGFEYRGGKEKCTQGMWMWSQPFIFVNSDGQRVAVLLMDTQGAWDNTLTKHQSATIFGLTAMISSKLIYNIQNRIDQNQIGNLDYFTTVAQAVGVDLPGGDNIFGHLEILIRDWCHYEEGWNFQQCGDQMKEHLEQHLGVETGPLDVMDRNQRLRSTFRQVDCHGLVHPGKRVEKRNWDGAISDVQPDFFFLLDDFCNTFFAGDFPQPSSPLGSKLTVANFERSLIHFVDAFRNNQMAIGLRDAFVKVQIMTARELMIKEFVAKLFEELPEYKVYDPLSLERETSRIKGIHIESFSSKLKPFRMTSEDEKSEIEEFIRQIENPMNMRMQENDKALESGTMKLVASPVVGLMVFFIANHHVIVYVGVPIATYATLKRHAANKQMRMFSPEVLKAAGNDGKIFMTDRYRDMQAIMIASNYLTPKTVQDAIEGEVIHMTAVQVSGGPSKLCS